MLSGKIGSMIPSRCGARRGRLRAGYTLVEVLIVVLILGIAAALAAPMMGRTPAARLRGAADMLAADLNFAQIESITHPDDLRLIIFDTATATYRIAPSSNPASPIHNPIGNITYATTFGVGRAAAFDGVTIASHSLDGDEQLRFGQYGQLDQATPATITLACGERSITLTVDATLGEVTVGPVE